MYSPESVAIGGTWVVKHLLLDGDGVVSWGEGEGSFKWRSKFAILIKNGTSSSEDGRRQNVTSLMPNIE